MTKIHTLCNLSKMFEQTETFDNANQFLTTLQFILYFISVNYVSRMRIWRHKTTNNNIERARKKVWTSAVQLLFLVAILKFHSAQTQCNDKSTKESIHFSSPNILIISRVSQASVKGQPTTNTVYCPRFWSFLKYKHFK